MAQTGLGAALRRAREAQGLSLEDAERDTRISKRYLDALENERFEVVPAPVYARGFLRSYSQYLGLDPNEVLALFPKEEEPLPQRGLARNGGASRAPLGGGATPTRVSRARAPMLESDQRQSIMWAVIALGGVLFIVIIAALIARAGDDDDPGRVGAPGSTLEEGGPEENVSADDGDTIIGGEATADEGDVVSGDGTSEETDGEGGATDGADGTATDGGSEAVEGLVPDVRGMPIDEALAVLDEAGYQPLLFPEEGVDPDNSVVRDQSPAPDTAVEPGGVVSLILRAP